MVTIHYVGGNEWNNATFTFASIGDNVWSERCPHTENDISEGEYWAGGGMYHWGRTETCGRWYTSEDSRGQVDTNVNQFFCRDCILKAGIRW